MIESSSFSLYREGQYPLLPAFIKPKPSELFSSWVIRLAHAHYMKAHTFTSLLFPKHSFWNRDIDRSVSEDVINLLALKTNSNFSQIYDTTLRSYEGKLFEVHNEKTSSKWILPLGIYHRTWNRNGLMFCPGCLLKDWSDPYYRKQWRLSLSVVCPICECYLQDKCPQCNSPILFFRAELGYKSKPPEKSIDCCHSCGLSLANGSLIKADTEIIAVQKNLYIILRYGWGSEVIYPCQFFEVARCVLKILVGNRAIYVLAQKKLATILQIEYEVAVGGTGHRFDVLPILNRANALKMLYWLFEEWPLRFIDFFKSIPFYSSDLLRDSPNLPFWYYSVVYSNFYKSNINRCF